MIKYFKILIISILLTNSVKAETIYDALASSYLNNNELNSQREKTIAVDEDLIQALSIFKPSLTGTIHQSDYLNEDQTNYSGQKKYNQEIMLEKVIQDF